MEQKEEERTGQSGCGLSEKTPELSLAAAPGNDFIQGNRSSFSLFRRDTDAAVLKLSDVLSLASCPRQEGEGGVSMRQERTAAWLQLQPARVGFTEQHGEKKSSTEIRDSSIRPPVSMAPWTVVGWTEQLKPKFSC